MKHIITTAHGHSIAGLQRAPGGIQVNVFKPAAGGAALFVVYPENFTDEQAIAAAAKVLERGPLIEGVLKVDGALVAGGMPMPKMTVTRSFP